MEGHFDVHHAISMRPYPLMHMQVSRTPSHQESSGPHSPPASPAPRTIGKSRAASTAIETTSANRTARRPGSHTVDDDDVEGTTDIRFNDPLQLSTRLKTVDEIDEIRTSISRRSSLVGPLTLGKDAVRARRVEQFYEGQNENIHRLLKPVDEHRAEAKAFNDSNALQYKIAVHGSLIANICLAVLQVYGGVASGSLSLLTTMADALFDPLSTLTLILCHRAVNKVNAAKFPQGKARIETAGNITFCFVMGAVSLVLIVVSIRDLVQGSSTLTESFHLPSIIAVAIAFVTKLCLFLYCYSLRKRYSQVRILWEDHRNDLLINGAGLVTSVLGSKLRWWIDPMGAIILSVLIITLWLRTAWSEFQLLIGVSADTPMLQHLTYISMTHSPHIKALDTVRAWHSGPRLIVEIDIVMDAELSLRKTHDVAEELQVKLESLPSVDRAYVHVDYETSHAPEHFLKKEI